MPYSYQKMILLTVLLIWTVTGCGVHQKLSSKPEFSRENYRQGHYFYEDNMITLSVLIQKSDLRGGYQYLLLLVNRGSSPLPLNYYSDILTINYNNKIYSLRKSTQYSAYPSSLDPGESTIAVFQLDGMFSLYVYDIEQLMFKLGEKRYILERNPQALWQDKDNLY
ncbi:MAG: hypothetical protein EH225_07355 [Calditrichaeota bacterium]|nr:hypothetical protein [Calditrichota bacterium]RQW03267.1 MAG: hypothetical protein EH225_07355 [Calditrichota bacterium]